MKKNLSKTIAAFLITAMMISTKETFAQAQRVEVTTTSTTSEGTISEFGPQGVVIKTETGTQPVRYISNETTNYVDQDGNPVSAAAVRSGLPVTVYYTKVGDTLIASKIMVRRLVAAPTQPLETTQTSTSSAGTISEFGRGRILIKTEASPDPLDYSYTKTTTYIDENGAPVSIETVKSGLPVTVFYTKAGNVLVASKVIVRRAVIASPEVLEQKKTTTTTITTEK